MLTDAEFEKFFSSPNFMLRKEHEDMADILESFVYAVTFEHYFDTRSGDEVDVKNYDDYLFWIASTN